MADDVCYPIGLANSGLQLTTSRAYFISVVPSVDRFYDTFSFATSQPAAAAMTNLFAGIYKITAANTLTRVVDCGNIKPYWNATRTLQQIPLPDIIDAKAGETYYIGLLSVGGTAPTLLRTTNVAMTQLTTGQIPEPTQITAVSTTSGLASLSATMTISDDVNTNNLSRYWGSLGSAEPPAAMSAYYHDTFNRIDEPVLPLPFASHPSTANFGIYNSTASPAVDASPAYAYWVPAMKSDDHYVEVVLGADMATEADRDINLYIGLRGMASGGAGPSVKLHIYPRGSRNFRIVTTTDSYNNAGLTQRAVPPEMPTFDIGDVVKLVADGSVYTAFLNDVPLCSWIDSGGIHPISEDHRRVNMMTSATSIANLQIADDFECGDYGGGVQLVGLQGIPSTTAFGTPTVTANLTVTPAAAPMTLTGGTPTIRTGLAAQPAKATMTLLPGTPTVTVAPHPTQFTGATGGSTWKDASVHGNTNPLEDTLFHTATGNDRVVFVFASHITSGSNVIDYPITYGGVAMTSVANLAVYTSAPGWRLRVWALLDPPSTQQQVAIKLGATNAALQAAAYSVVSYSGVSSYATFGGGQMNNIGGTSLSMTVNGIGTDSMIVQAFAQLNPGLITNYSQAMRNRQARDATSSYDASLIVGDSYGSASGSTTFSATGGGALYWAGYALRLIAAP
ncbi:hypothetical protein JRC04_04785 [Mycolicibacterium sp. S2-37]|uniref:hypothetical protein n=1 Tax=Mycolicibacterium sp. S2-37 TaxID=2810297 RepID=UPI001A9491F2|nr:hypothetical protein [Mycolicibacterium sp. S2-37]MBO0676775.1 hypothetical protein [Mycolicibacterium sp. S2-37]